MIALLDFHERPDLERVQIVGCFAQNAGGDAGCRAEISGLTRELGVTTVYVTHDQAEALTMADRVAIMRRGVLQDVGTPTQVYNRPGTIGPLTPSS